MAQACYDPREAVNVWQRMKLSDHNQTPEYISTHPSHGNDGMNYYYCILYLLFFI